MPDTANTEDDPYGPITVSVAQAAKMLSLSPWSVYQLLDEQAIESRYKGRRRLVLVDSLRAYVKGLPTEAPRSA